MTRRTHQRLDHSVPSPTQGVRPQISDGFLLTPNSNPPEAEHKARLTVVWLAEDADDARTLLDALGLL